MKDGYENGHGRFFRASHISGRIYAFYLFYLPTPLLQCFVMFQRVRFLKLLVHGLREPLSPTNPPSSPPFTSSSISHSISSLPPSSSAPLACISSPCVASHSSCRERCEGREGGINRRWGGLKSYLVTLISSILEEPFLFLAKSADLSVINKALLYMRDNEQTSRVLIVHFSRHEGEEGREKGKGERNAEKESFMAAVRVIDKIYPKIMVSALE